MDIMEFWNRLPSIPADRLVIKYLTQTQSYALIRDYFLTHKQYTHLVMLPDDLLAEYSHFVSLQGRVMETDHPVLSGICNAYCRTEAEIATKTDVCVDKPLARDRRERVINVDDRHSLKRGIIRVKYVGLSLIFIRRDVVERFPFEGDLKYQDIRRVRPYLRYNMNSDAMFCNNCIDRDIPIMVDTRIFMFHLRIVQVPDVIKRLGYDMTGVDKILVGQKKPDRYLIRSNGSFIAEPFEWPDKLVFPRDQFDMTNTQETYLEQWR